MSNKVRTDLERGPWKKDNWWVSHYSFAAEVTKEFQLPARVEIYDSSGSGFGFKYKDFPVRMAFGQPEYGKYDVMGNPFLVSQEKGEKIYERMTDLFAEFIRVIKDVKVEIMKKDFPERF